MQAGGLGLAALVGAGVLAGLVAAMLAVVAAAPRGPEVLAAYATRLDDRAPRQRHNARLAANALDGAVTPAGGEFSFNRRVESWSVDRGYVRAPVSFGGELLPAFGGGVCQTSTTLYNAALLAGLEVLERHPHAVAPGYAAPGRDAAVAYPSLDLRLRNPYPFPIRIRATARGGLLAVRILGARRPEARFHVESHILDRTEPEQRTTLVPREALGGASGRRSPGREGFRVVVYRTATVGGSLVRKERLSDNTYMALHRTVALADDQ
ncbi:MAG TPA: VanW family protein [Chthonomonadales bacterium]|nr:VanW family protein [Chthonomonadales bacterium]